jgi:transposase
MNLLKYGVGIDMAMEKFDVCFSVIDTEQKVTVKASSKFENNITGFKSFIKWLKRHKKENIPLVLLVEATGIYHEQLSWFLFSNDYNISIILPNKSKKYMQSLGLKSKNDKIDSKGLSRMVCEQYIKPWQPISKQLYLLRIATRQLETITAQITVIGNQLHALQKGMYQDKEIEKMLNKHICLLEKNKEQLLDHIKQIVERDEVLKQKIENLTSIKGIGLLAAAVVIAETNGFALIENQAQLVSYVGYDVVENQSGNRSGRTKISKHGNSHIRRILHFPALNVVRYKVPVFCSFFERIVSKHNIKMKAYVAVQKKLLIVMYALWKKNEPYKLQIK